MTGRASLALVADFHAVLLAEGTVLFLVFVLLAIGWVACRELLLARARAWLAAQRGRWPAEPGWRRVLRIGFGVLWIADGLLQAQPDMPGGLPSQVILPAASGSPGWVGHIAVWGAHAWSADPVHAAAATVWIQLGIGIWLVSVSSPPWSRLAGLASAGWGMVVWVLGEAFGGILAPHGSWLTGAPGAALFYCVAGGLLALPVRYWRDPRLERLILRGMGALLAAAALVQAWPRQGFWQGRRGPLASWIDGMASVGQPAGPRDLVGWFGSVVAVHGFAVNLVAVLTLAAAAAGLLAGRPEITRPVAGAMIGFCLADWVLVQDFGIFGGVGTDPNSMLPQVLILIAGLLAPAAASVVAEAPAADAAAAAEPRARLSRHPLALLRPDRAARRLGLAFGTASASAVLAIWAIVMVLMGAGPLTLAAVHRGATPAVAHRAAGVTVRTAGCAAAGPRTPPCQ